ncbi:hypothetical protein OSB04_021052 [Centaurea solstitialis]|uniref:BHLH domain-containing protein n=1 Tax=Centaurea solstitialis TaxID=347529 RepID=A0AA38WFW0_9ASTR|nr:hypothetical protein OSB04_021052 [Centaurea solstitialis]
MEASSYWESFLQTDDCRYLLNFSLLLQSTDFKSTLETKLFVRSSCSWGILEDTFSGYYSSSPDGPQSSTTSKNIVSERNRRKKLNDRLFALRASSLILLRMDSDGGIMVYKMDKASIIKDAIDYIQLLHDQERAVQAELMELESRKLELENLDFGQETEFPSMERTKKKKREQGFDSSGSRPYPIQVIQLSVKYMGEKIVLVSLKCSKRRDTIVKLCEVFESLKLKIVNANISAFSESLFNTLFVQADEEEIDILRLQIEAAISALNDPHCPMDM